MFSNASFPDGLDFSQGDGSALSAAQTNYLVTDSLARIQGRLQSALSRVDATDWLENIFVTSDEATTETFIAEMLVDKLVFPEVQLLDSAQMQGNAGKYSADDNTIYLASDLTGADTATGLVNTLSEEVGHYIDTLLGGGQDTPGNEGVAFRKALWADDEVAATDALSTVLSDRNGNDNSRGKARNLGVLNRTKTVRDSVDGRDLNDYYRFTLNATSEFDLLMNGLRANANVQLFNSSGRSIGRSTAGGTGAERISKTLDAGNYYVRVFPSGSATTDYKLRLSAKTVPTRPDPAGNTRGKALNVGTLDGDRTFRDFVGGADTNDYYRFRVNQSSDFSLSLSGLSADADVQLLSSRGALIDSSSRASDSDESIETVLEKGNYYVRVLPYNSAQTNYKLDLSAASAAPADGAGDTLASARNLGTLSGSSTFTDAVGTANDTNDYYRFRLDDDSDFSLDLSGLGSDADVQLLSRDGQVIESSTGAGNSAESIDRLLTAGTYYVRVYPYSGSTDYSLRLNARTRLPADGAGNTLSTAKNVGALVGNRTFQELVGTTDTNDYYRFSLSRSSRFRLSMTGMDADADVQLLDSSGSTIEGSYGEGSLSEEIERTLEAGTYYVRVYPYSGNSTDYRLALSANAIGSNDGAGNTLATARNLGALDGTIALEDAVSENDTSDYYRFSVARNSNFSLALTELRADVDVQVLNSSGGLIDDSRRASTTSESIELSLSAGTYYVRVYPYAGLSSTANSSYKLTLSATQATAGFNRVYGYGLVDAATAVASALGRSTALPDVADRGGNDWGADLVNAPEAWARGYTGDGVVVAVVDTGVDFSHPDLSSNLWFNPGEIGDNGIDDDRNGFVDDIIGWDFNGRDYNPYDEQGHGTHVAGTIAGDRNNFGVTGIAYDADIMSVRVLGANGSGSNVDVAAGIRYAADNGADVINLSLGSNSGDSGIESAVRYATQLGSFVVMASGNDGYSQPGFPARYATNYGVSVGAVDRYRRDAYFSNSAGSNSNLRHVVAPGVDVYSTLPRNSYGNNSGTSMATPHVAGVVALMLEANPNLSHNQIRQILTNSSTRLS